MKSLADFLLESDDGKLKHLEHVEDHVINDGKLGFVRASNHLHDIHKQMTGGSGKTHVSMKLDGSPSLVFGHHPQSGKFFVASKSAFNKTPKINYTHADIDQNHGHAPGLARKLKSALDNLPHVTPRGIYQGDIMHTTGDLQNDGKHVHFTPNTLTYSVPSDSPHGKAALASKIGIAVHTKYHGDDMGSMHSKPINDLSEFGSHKNVHLIGAQHNISGSQTTKTGSKHFESHMAKAEAAHNAMQPKDYAAIKGHEIPLKSYINHTVRTGETPNVVGFTDHYKKSHEKKIEAVKTPKSKTQKSITMLKDINHVHKNANSFDMLLAIHKHLQNAKNVLVKGLSKGSEFEHSINGKPTNPEGFVVSGSKGPASKFVNRGVFSRANFAKNRG